MVRLFKRRKDIYAAILAEKAKGKSIGFVPTMGALHQGHISLIARSVAENDVSVSSVFVNPIQFNNKQDLEKYPRTLEDDIQKLDAAGCDMVFAPSMEEMYPEKHSEQFHFGSLESVMDGASRPGHFNGVGVVVSRLFDICIPNKAYFGEKDYQQLMIIRELVRIRGFDIEIIGCPIIREADGLAMSSRNIRLKEEERAIAPVIYNTLNWIRAQAGKESVSIVLKRAGEMLSVHENINVEYVQLVNEKNLLPVNGWDETADIRAFVALFLGEVRLIDNMKIT